MSFRSSRQTRSSTRLRRQAMVAAGACVALLMSACGGGDDGGGAPADVAGGQVESEVVVAAGGGALAAAVKEAAVKAGEANGFKVQMLEGNSADNFAKLQAQARAGQVGIDIMLVNTKTYRAMAAQKLTAPLDMSALPSVDGLDKTWALPPVLGTEPEAVRNMLSLDVIAYNKDVLAKRGLQPPTSWADLVKPEYASCAILVNPISGSNYVPLLNRSVGSGFDDIDATLNRMRPLADEYVAVLESSTAALETLQQGTGCVSPAAMNRTIEQIAAGAPLGMVIPEEGTSFYEGVYVIPANAPHPVAAHKTLNALLSPDGMRLLRDKAFYSVPVANFAPSTLPFAKDVPAVETFAESGAEEVPQTVYEQTDVWVDKWESVFAG